MQALTKQEINSVEFRAPENEMIRLSSKVPDVNRLLAELRNSFLIGSTLDLSESLALIQDCVNNYYKVVPRNIANAYIGTCYYIFSCVHLDDQLDSKCIVLLHWLVFITRDYIPSWSHWKLNNGTLPDTLKTSEARTLSLVEYLNSSGDPFFSRNDATKGLSDLCPYSNVVEKSTRVDTSLALFGYYTYFSTKKKVIIFNGNLSAYAVTTKDNLPAVYDTPFDELCEVFGLPEDTNLGYMAQWCSKVLSGVYTCIYYIGCYTDALPEYLGWRHYAPFDELKVKDDAWLDHGYSDFMYVEMARKILSKRVLSESSRKDVMLQLGEQSRDEALHILRKLMKMCYLDYNYSLPMELPACISLIHDVYAGLYDRISDSGAATTFLGVAKYCVSEGLIFTDDSVNLIEWVTPLINSYVAEWRNWKYSDVADAAVYNISTVQHFLYYYNIPKDAADRKLDELSTMCSDNTLVSTLQRAQYTLNKYYSPVYFQYKYKLVCFNIEHDAVLVNELDELPNVKAKYDALYIKPLCDPLSLVYVTPHTFAVERLHWDRITYYFVKYYAVLYSNDKVFKDYHWVKIDDLKEANVLISDTSFIDYKTSEISDIEAALKALTTCKPDVR